jgi:hypothetical protein
MIGRVKEGEIIKLNIIHIDKISEKAPASDHDLPKTKTKIGSPYKNNNEKGIIEIKKRST